MTLRDNVAKAIKDLILPELQGIRGELVHMRGEFVEIRADLGQFRTQLGAVDQRMVDFSDRLQMHDAHLLDQSRRIDDLRSELGARIEEVRSDLSTRIDEVRRELTGRIDLVNARLDALGVPARLRG